MAISSLFHRLALAFASYLRAVAVETGVRGRAVMARLGHPPASPWRRSGFAA